MAVPPLEAGLSSLCDASLKHFNNYLPLVNLVTVSLSLPDLLYMAFETRGLKCTCC